MSRPTNIPPKLHEEIVQKASEGLTAEQIVNYLSITHKIDSNLSAIYRILRANKREKQQATQAVYAEAAAQSASKDLEIINQVIERLNKEYIIKLDAKETKEATDLLNVMFKFQSKRMELSGIGKETADSEDILQEAKENLLKRLTN